MRRGILRDAFPAIREIILTESPRLGRPIDKYDIGPKFKEHPRVRALLRTGCNGEQGSVNEYTRNLVDWYSREWTQHEAHELDPRQSDWILPTFHGVRRTGGARSGHAWRFEPIEAQSRG